MNRIYRLVFNTALGQVQVASELASHASRAATTPSAARAPRRLALAAWLGLFCAAPGLAVTLPTGGSLGSGVATIDTSVANAVTVTQTGNRALINWNSFSISSDGAVNFVQPNTGAITLNVVNGALASQIDGVLNATGQVFLINTNGIVFGSTASVNVGGLVASSLPLTQGDADSNLWQVGGNGVGASTFVNVDGAVIDVGGGSISLVGSAVQNTGVLRASRISLVAGGRNEITYDAGTGLFSARVLDAASASVLSSPLINTGTLNATNIFLDAWGPAGGTSINLAGNITATGIDPATGSLVIHSTNGAVVNSGTIKADDVEILSYTNGSVGGSGSLEVAGATTIATDGAITLGNAANAFGGAVSLDGKATAITASGGLDLAAVSATTLNASAGGELRLGSVTTSGAATLVATDAINGYGALDIGGTSAFTSTSSGITLTSAGSQFADTVSLTGGSTQIAADGTLKLGNVSVSDLRASAATISLGSTVETSGAQQYLGPVVLRGATTLESTGNADIQFTGTIDGNAALNVTTGGVTRFGGEIGGTTALASLATDAAGSTELAGNVMTLGNISFGDPLQLLASSMITSVGGGVRLAAISGAYDLALNSNTGTVFNGDATLRSLTVGGAGSVSLGGDITATGAVAFLPAVALTHDVTVSAADIEFYGQLNGNHALTLRAPGVIIADADIGAGAPLAGLDAEADLLSLRGIATSGGLRLASGGALVQNGSYQVGGNASFTSDVNILLTNAGNTFGGTLSLSGQAVNVLASSNLVFGQVDATSLAVESLVGNISQQGVLDVSGTSSFRAGTGNIDLALANHFGDAVSLNGGTVRIAATGALALDAVTATDLTASADTLQLKQDITTSGYQSYQGAIGLTHDTVLDAGGTLSLDGSIDGNYALTLAASGLTTLTGDVGLATPLRSLTVNGPARIGARFRTQGNLSFLGHVELSGDSTLTSIGSNVDVAQVDGTHALALNATQGLATLGTTGASRALDSLRITAGGASLTGASITTTGTQQYGAPVTLGQSLVASSSGGGDIVFGGTIDGGHALVVNTAGVTRFDNAVGNTLFLTSLTTDAAGSTHLGGSISTTGNITLNDAVVLDAFSGLQAQAGAITFGKTVTGASGLIVQGGAGTTFGGAVDVADLVVQGGGTTRLGGNVVVDTSATFGRPVLLTTDVDISGQALGFGGDIDGAYALGLRAGSVSVAGNLGANTALASLDITASSLGVGSITTTGDLSLEVAGNLTQAAAYRVGGDTRLDAGGDIVLTNVGNRFDGKVAVTGGNVSLSGGTGLDLDQVQANRLDALASGRLDLANADIAGNATLDGTAIGFNGVRIGGNLVADAAGAIGQTGALQVGGSSTLAAGGDLTLADAANRFGGALDLQGQAVTLAAAGDVAVSRLANGSNAAVNLQAGGNLSIAQAIDTGSAALTLTALGGELDVVAGLAGGQVQLAGAGGIALGAGVVADSLTLRSQGGVISQGTGSVQVAGTTDVDSGAGAINLASGGNHFGGTVNLRGGATQIAGDALQLGSVAVTGLRASASGGLELGSGASVAGDATLAAGSGALSLGAMTVGGKLQASGATITQAGALDIAGSSSFSSTGDIVLDVAGNRFGGDVALQGRQATIVAGGNLSFGQVAVDALQASSSGNLTQTAAMRVSGDSELAAGGALVLDNAGNDFQGLVSARGTGIALADANDLRVGTINSGGGGTGATPAALSAQPLASGAGDVTLIAGGTLTLPAQAIDIGDATLTLRSNGGSLSVQSALSAGNIALGGRDGITLGADVTAANMLDLRSNGAISQASGRLTAAMLTGQAGGAATLQGDNRIAALGDFSAGSLSLANGASLAVQGNVHGGSAMLLDVRSGDLAINGTLAADAVRLQSAGAIEEGSQGSIVTAALSGRSGGATRLGTADAFVANQVATLGDFAAPGGFSLTNATTLTLASLNGSSFSVDAGEAAFFLKVDGGDLLQAGTTPVHAGDGHWWSSGRIGTSQAPIYVVTTYPTQVVDFVGLPPAYFYAVHPDGTPVSIGGAVNVPTTAVAARAQSGSLHRVAYIDIGALNSEYRAFGIVKPGIRLPLDQVPACDAGDPDADCAQ